MGATRAGLLLIRKNYLHGTGDKKQNDSHIRNLSRPNQFSVSFDSLLSTPNNVVNFSQYSTFIYYILQMSTLNFYHQSHFMLIWQTVLTARGKSYKVRRDPVSLLKKLSLHWIRRITKVPVLPSSLSCFANTISFNPHKPLRKPELPPFHRRRTKPQKS